MTSPQAEHDLAQIAHRQGGVFTRSQASAVGLSRAAVAHRIERGRWTVVHGPVLTAATSVLDTTARVWSALLAAGPAAVVSHASAAALWGLGVPAPAEVELTTSAGRTPTVPGTLVRRRSLGPDDVTQLDGTPITSRVRTVLDCLTTLPPVEAGLLMDRCWRAGLVTPLRLAEAAGARRGSTGVAQLRLLAEGPLAGQVWFPVERLAAVLRRAGVRGWELHHLVAPGVLAPLAFPTERLAVLVEARLPELRLRDQEQRTSLELQGWRALSLDWHVAALDPPRALQVLARARAAAGKRVGAGP